MKYALITIDTSATQDTYNVRYVVKSLHKTFDSAAKNQKILQGLVEVADDTKRGDAVDWDGRPWQQQRQEG